MIPKKIRALIVDDSPVMAKLTAKNAEAIGFETAVRKNGAEAISYIGNNPTDIMLLDIELEGSRLNGIQIANVVRKKFDIPVVFITGHDDAEIFRNVGVNSGFYVVMKPYDLKRLRMQAEVALMNRKIDVRRRNLELWLDSILDQFPEPALILDGAGLVVKANLIATSAFNVKIGSGSVPFFEKNKFLFDAKSGGGFAYVQSVEELADLGSKIEGFIVSGKNTVATGVRIKKLVKHDRETPHFLLIFDFKS